MADTPGEAVQKELQDYLAKKNINDLFIRIVEQLLMEKPDNPVQFIVDYLGKNFPDQVKDASSGATHIEEKIDELTDDDEDDEEDEDLGDMPEFKAVERVNRRVSVSASVMCTTKAQNFKPVVHPKTDDEKGQIKSILLKSILFGHLDDEQTHTIVDAMYAENYDAGAEIIVQGDKVAENYYVLASGGAEVYKDGELVMKYEEGGGFGELALMYNAPRAATVKCSTSCKVWCLDRLTFKHIIVDSTIKKRQLYQQFLEKIPLLSSLTEYERATIADSMDVETKVKDDLIINEGDDGDRFYIIKSGTVDCIKGGACVLSLEAGSYFGEIALLTDKPRQASVKATSDVELLFIERKTFQRVMGPLSDILKRNMSHYNQVVKGHTL